MHFGWRPLAAVAFVILCGTPGSVQSLIAGHMQMAALVQARMFRMSVSRDSVGTVSGPRWDRGTLPGPLSGPAGSLRAPETDQSTPDGARLRPRTERDGHGPHGWRPARHDEGTGEPGTRPAHGKTVT